MKRKSKITPEIFLSLCLFRGDDLCRSSLLQLKSRLESKEDIIVSPQALDQRLNEKAVDSTTIILPQHLETTYRGSGGSASIAAVKVQLQIDLLTGSFIKCDISEAVSNDADYLPVLRKSIEKKDLHLEDLGYFDSGHLNFLANSEAK